jgi:uridine kinase
MNAQYGNTTLSDALRNRIKKSTADIVVYESIRWQSDLDMVRSFENNVVLYVTAPVELRYERTILRGEKVDEAETSFDKFVSDEQVATETEIVRLSKYADYKIENTETEADFELKLNIVI